MSANIILDISQVKPQCSGRFWDLIVDHNFTGHFVPTNITPGLPGQFLATGTGPTVHWSDLPTQPVVPGAPNSILQTNALGTAAVWNTDLKVPGTLTVDSTSTLTGDVTAEADLDVTNDFKVLLGKATVAQGDLEVTQGDFDVLAGATSLQNARVYGNCIVEGGCNLNSNAQIIGELNLLNVVKFGGVGPTVNQVPLCTAPGVVQWSMSPPTSGVIPGLPRQILQTNTAGTASEWTSNLKIGNLEVTGPVTFDTSVNVAAGNLSLTLGDLVLYNGGLEIQSGALTVAGNINNNFGALANFTNVNVNGNLLLGTAGTSGNFVKKTGASTQAWSNIVPSDVKGGLVNQFLQSDGTNGVWNSNITCPGSVITLGTVTTSGVVNITQDLRFVSSSGTSGQFVKKTGAATQTWSNLAVSDIKGGTLNQVFQSNGTNGVWNTDVTLPGNLAMSSGTAIASFLETRQIGALKLGGNFAGTLGAVCVSDASSVPHWEFPQYYVEYYQNVAVDMNGGGAVLLMAAASANVSNAGITYLAGVFTCPPGIYEAIFTTRPVVISGGKTQINFRVNGSYAGSTCSLSSITEAQQINLRRTFRFNASSTIEVVSEVLVAGAVNTSGTDSNGLATTVLTIQRLGAYV